MMIIEAIDTRGRRHYFPRKAESIDERRKALEEFLIGLKEGEWFADQDGNVVSPVHILSFKVK